MKRQRYRMRSIRVGDPLGTTALIASRSLHSDAQGDSQTYHGLRLLKFLTKDILGVMVTIS